jgi:activator of 2-hydroxyglutaryl-CoA dehydratase
VARNKCVVNQLESMLGCEIIIPEDPDLVGARGAAEWGRKQVHG